MTPEEKQLLLKDICARLPYGVIVNVPIIGGSENKKLVSIINEDDGIPCVSVYSCEVRNSNGELVSYAKSPYLLCDIIPYLRPMSSMTEEELNELLEGENSDFNGKSELVKRAIIAYSKGDILLSNELFSIQCSKTVDWLNSHHFDYRGLIEKGLALEAPEGMYKEK